MEEGQHKIPLHIIAGGTAAERESSICQLLENFPGSWALVLEGIPSGKGRLEGSEQVHLSRIAAGCLCCTGNLVMKVTLNRMLRLKPQRVAIGLADETHAPALQAMLQSAPYDQLLALQSGN